MTVFASEITEQSQVDLQCRDLRVRSQFTLRQPRGERQLANDWQAMNVLIHLIRFHLVGVDCSGRGYESLHCARTRSLIHYSSIELPQATSSNRRLDSAKLNR